MTDNSVKFTPIKDLRRQAVLTSVIILVSIVSAWAGTGLNDTHGGAAIVSSPFDGGFVTGCMALCIWDTLTALALTLCRRYLCCICTAAAVFSLRGAALGAAASFCLENTVSASALGIIISYAAITLLFAVYIVLLSGNEEQRTPYRMLCYLAVSGAAALLRVIPYLLI